MKRRETLHVSRKDLRTPLGEDWLAKTDKEGEVELGQTKLEVLDSEKLGKKKRNLNLQKLSVSRTRSTRCGSSHL